VAKGVRSIYQFAMRSSTIEESGAGVIQESFTAGASRKGFRRLKHFLVIAGAPVQFVEANRSPGSPPLAWMSV
jgi:hypothetical protein